MSVEIVHCYIQVRDGEALFLPSGIDVTGEPGAQLRGYVIVPRESPAGVAAIRILENERPGLFRRLWRALWGEA